MSAELWIVIYLGVVAILTLIEIIRYSELTPNSGFSTRQFHIQTILTLTLSLGVAIFIGIRPISLVFVDMVTYAHKFEVIPIEEPELSWSNNNLIFDNALIWCSSHDITASTFFLVCDIIYFVVMAIALIRIFPQNSLYAFIIYLGAFSTFSYGTNGIRAGLAASCFLLALSFYRKNIFWLIFFSIISYGLHHSMQLSIGALIICYLISNKRFYILFWFTCLLISALHIDYFQHFFGELTDTQGQGYLFNEDEVVTTNQGYRIDFIFYTAIPLIIYWFCTKKGVLTSKVYTFYLNLYMMISGIWMLCINASFTNRIAYLAWQLLPLVSIYPFLNINLKEPAQYKELNIIATIYLSFTLLYNLL